jgi:hypothetical protein
VTCSAQENTAANIVLVGSNKNSQETFIARLCFFFDNFDFLFGSKHTSSSSEHLESIFNGWIRQHHHHHHHHRQCLIIVIHHRHHRLYRHHHSSCVS